MKADLLQQAVTHHQAGELQKAGHIYQQILANKPDHADANHLLGLIAHQCGNHDVALQLVSTAIQSNPSNHIYFCNLGLIHIALQQWDNAITDFQTAIKLHHGDIKAHINLGLALEKKERAEEAIASYQQALSLNPADTETLNKLGNLYAQLKRIDLATASFKQALQLSPGSLATLNNLGIMFRDLKQAEQAITYYQKALKIAPENVAILCNLAITLQDTGELQKAEVICQQALLYDPSYAEVYKQLTDNLLFQQRTTDWNAMLDTALEQATLSAASRNHMFISKAIIAWMNGNNHQCSEFLDSAESILSQPVTDKLTYSALGYYKFLQALVQFRSKQPSLYSQPVERDIHIIGDSHSLSYAGTILKFEGKASRVIPHLIMGCKAWHLSQDKGNRFKASFDCVLQQLSNEDTVIISMGEIDCRTDEGIFPAHKKNGNDLSASIETLVDSFVAYILDKCEKKNLEVIFYGVPAPACTLKHLSSNDRSTYLRTVQLFNRFLSQAAQASSCKFIDTYRKTVAEDGSSNKKHHLDLFHLAPDFLSNCLH